MKSHLTQQQNKFIRYLTSLNTDEHRGELATLRRGLSGNPVEDLNLYRLLARKVPDEDRDTRREPIYYLVAALYAFHPVQTDKGNFGDAMRQVAIRRDDQDAAERRFTALLNARLDDLARPLRQALMMIKQAEPPVPVNWASLFGDLLYWDSPRKSSQRAWANGFWAYERPAGPDAGADLIPDGASIAGGEGTSDDEASETNPQGE